MKKKFAIFVVLLLIIGATSNSYATENKSHPSSLATTVQNLMTLLSDGKAVGYPESTMTQTVSDGIVKVVLVVFSLEGFSGGNNWQQYLAVFQTENNQHFMLTDVIHIGGGGWRVIDKLKARTSRNLIDVDAIENKGMDSPNFPSKKTTIQLIFSNGRLKEKSK